MTMTLSVIQLCMSINKREVRHLCKFDLAVLRLPDAGLAMWVCVHKCVSCLSGFLLHVRASVLAAIDHCGQYRTALGCFASN